MLRPYVTPFHTMTFIHQKPDETEEPTDDSSHDDSQDANEQANGGNSSDAPEGNSS